MTKPAESEVTGGPSLTIYNRDLAVVRETVRLDLRQGENRLVFDHATAKVLPDSVLLRDPDDRVAFSVLEQSYRNDPVSAGLLLKHFEGQTIDFRCTYPDGKVEVKPGRIVRAGYVSVGKSQDPIIEVDGRLRFQLPGEPLFPALGDNSILRPTLGWVIHSTDSVVLDAQLSYLSRGFTWEADYNLVAPEKGDVASLTGWITVENGSGTSFDGARIKLVAGDVRIFREPLTDIDLDVFTVQSREIPEPSRVVQKPFDDFHLYTLPRPLTLHDQETKQMEFLRSSAVRVAKKYVCEVGRTLLRPWGQPITKSDVQKYGSVNVTVEWQFTNEEANGLGVPLPAGRIRVYRIDDDDGNLEFVGENTIDHTPRNEELSISTGNAFDLVGERKVVDFEANSREKWMRESIEVTVRNRSADTKEVTVREHLWRWTNWSVQDATDSFEKVDVGTIEFVVRLAPDEERTVAYTARYAW